MTLKETLHRKIIRTKPLEFEVSDSETSSFILDFNNKTLKQLHDKLDDNEILTPASTKDSD